MLEDGCQCSVARLLDSILDSRYAVIDLTRTTSALLQV